VKLSVREAARILSVSETKVYRWVDEEEIPFVMIQHRPMFNRVELLEWAMEEELPVGADLYEDDHECPLATALERGGGRVVGDSLATFAAELPIESAPDRELIGTVIAARQAEMFVGRAADHIAVPKARSPIVCPGTPPLVALGWCGQSALVIGGVPMTVVFAIVAPTVKQHLKLLSRLSLALHDPGFRAAVQERGAFERVIAEAGRFERDLEGRP